MILFENVRLLGLDPPSVSEPVDVAAYGPEDGGPDAGTIAGVGQGLAAVYPGASKAGSGGHLSPGLVCGHTHLYSALARGIEVAIEPSRDFAQILRHLWRRLDRAIDLPILASSALSGCADALAAGVTSLVDHHAGPNAIDGSLSVIREAYEETGIRGILCYETTDRNGLKGPGRESARMPASPPKSTPCTRPEPAQGKVIRVPQRTPLYGALSSKPPSGATLASPWATRASKPSPTS